MPKFQVAKWFMGQKLWILVDCRQPQLFLAAPTFQAFILGKYSQLLGWVAVRAWALWGRHGGSTQALNIRPWHTW